MSARMNEADILICHPPLFLLHWPAAAPKQRLVPAAGTSVRAERGLSTQTDRPRVAGRAQRGCLSVAKRGLGIQMDRPRVAGRVQRGGLSVAERGGAHLLGGQATRSPRFGCGSPTWVRVTLDSRAIRTQVSGSHPTREPAAGPADSTPVSVEGGRRSEAVVRSPRTTASVWPGSLQVAAQPSGLTPAAAASRPGHAPW
jgi:hypothetical protein